jgi:hypothetical protein
MEAVFLGVALKLLLDTPCVWMGHTKNQNRVLAQKDVTLDPTVGSHSNFYMSFYRLFSLASHKNFYSTPISSGRGRPRTTKQYQLKSYITPDPTVGSCSKFNRSSKRLVSLALQ